MIMPNDNLTNVTKEGRFLYYSESRDFHLDQINVLY